jgi:hypothetical protein
MPPHTAESPSQTAISGYRRRDSPRAAPHRRAPRNLTNHDLASSIGKNQVRVDLRATALYFGFLTPV